MSIRIFAAFRKIFVSIFYWPPTPAKVKHTRQRFLSIHAVLTNEKNTLKVIGRVERPDELKEDQMEVVAPPWLNETFLSSALGQGSDLRVVTFTVKPAVAAGNNYTSIVYRVSVEYVKGEATDPQAASLIVKAPIEMGIVQEMSEKMDFFAKEPHFYNNLLPKMSSLMEKEFGAEIYCCSRPNTLIFKDLNSEGYVLRDRQKQLDYLHCKLVLETLAKFHAVSVAIHHEDPTLVELTGQEPVYVEGGMMAEQFKPLYHLSIQMFTGMLKGMGEDEEIIELVTKTSSTLWETLLELFKPRKNGLNVLNHGDCWTSNILFKENESGEPIDVKLIDFQALRYMSPAIDLIYFFWSSANEDVRDNHKESLFESYRQTLNKTLEELNCEERMSFEELEETLTSASPFVLTMIGASVPMFLNEPENVLDSNDMKVENFNPTFMINWYQKMYSGKTFQSLLPGYIGLFKRWISSYGLGQKKGSLD